MTTTFEKVKASLAGGSVDPALLAEAVKEHEELVHRTDRLEELLIMIVRTGWPWDEEGEPNALYHNSREGFATAMKEARELLQLGRSRLTRTEPKTL